MPHAALSLDVLPLDADALLVADPFFVTVCDERSDRARAAQAAACCVRCGDPEPSDALTPEQAEHVGCDADADLVCWDCLKAIRAELAERPTRPAPPCCAACDGTGNASDPALPCRACSGKGYRVDRAATH